MVKTQEYQISSEKVNTRNTQKKKFHRMSMPMIWTDIAKAEYARIEVSSS